MTQPTFATKATLARQWQLDIRHRLLRELPADAYLKMGSRKVPLYICRSGTAQPKPIQSKQNEDNHWAQTVKGSDAGRNRIRR
jgi:hypothetical protein